jgi:hypothetical protein
MRGCPRHAQSSSLHDLPRWVAIKHGLRRAQSLGPRRTARRVDCDRLCPRAPPIAPCLSTEVDLRWSAPENVCPNIPATRPITRKRAIHLIPARLASQAAPKSEFDQRVNRVWTAERRVSTSTVKVSSEPPLVQTHRTRAPGESASIRAHRQQAANQHPVRRWSGRPKARCARRVRLVESPKAVFRSSTPPVTIPSQPPNVWPKPIARTADVTSQPDSYTDRTDRPKAR